MTVGTTTRFSLTTWSSGADEFTRDQMTTSHNNIETNAALFSTSSATPTTTTSATVRSFHWDSANSVLWFRGTTGHSWQQIYPVLQTEALKADLQPLDSDLTAIAGLSSTGMIVRSGSGTATVRSVAVSGTGISISNADGVSGNPTITLASSTSATENTVVLREVDGKITVGTPTGNSHAATKAYVDTADALKADAADVYTKTNIHDAKLYQYGNITSGGTDTSGGQLPSAGTRTTPRIYVQSNDPSAATGYAGVTGDIWFQI